jgi:hypothetical protein
VLRPMLTDARREGSHQFTEVREHSAQVLLAENELLPECEDLVWGWVAPGAGAENSLHLNDQRFAASLSFEFEVVETRRRVVVLSVLEDACWIYWVWVISGLRLCLPLLGLSVGARIVCGE